MTVSLITVPRYLLYEAKFLKVLEKNSGNFGIGVL